MNQNKSWKIAAIIIFSIFSIFCIIPFIGVISVSFSEGTDLIKNGYSLYPREFSTEAYQYIFAVPEQILNAYKNSIFVTVVGTFISVFVLSMAAFVLARPDYKFKRFLGLFFFFPMLFNGGMVSDYVWNTQFLNLKDNVLVLVLPMVVNVWYLFLLRTFMQKTPFSLIECAKLEGANEFMIYFKIALPLAKSGIATITLFNVLMYWNDWWMCLLYITDQSKITLQYYLYRIMANISEVTSNDSMFAEQSLANVPGQTIRMAMCVLAVAPIIIVLPFFQKYFVKGIAVGAVKE